MCTFVLVNSPRFIFLTGRCSDISALENGYILHNADIADGIYHGDSVNFQCNDGYQLFGSHTCYCDRGQWLLETGQSICLPSK